MPLSKGKKIPGIPWYLVIALVFMMMILFILGHFYYVKQEKQYLEDQKRYLSAMNAARAADVGKWIEERKFEGVFLMRNSIFLSLAAKLAASPGDRSLRREVESWFIPLRQNHDYLSITLAAKDGRILAAVGDTSGLSFPGAGPAGFNLASREILVTDFMINMADSSVYLDFVVPLSDQCPDCPFAVFQIDPVPVIYPIMYKHGTPDRGYHTLITAVRNGKRMVAATRIAGSDTLLSATIVPEGSLSHQRHRGEGALALVEELTSNTGQVVVDSKNIPGTSWSVVSHISLRELYGPLRKLALNVVVYILIFVAVLLVIGFLIWMQQRIQFYRNRLKLQMDHDRAEERLRFMNALMQEVNDAIITFDRDLMILSWNKGAERIYGWKAEEVVGKYGGGSLRVDFPGASRDSVFKELEDKGFWKGEVVHKRKDGSTAYLLSSTSQLRDESGNVLGIITINKDISAVIHSEKIKSAVYRISELAHSTRDLDDLFASIHVVIGELMDARNLFIAMIDPDRRHLSYPYFIDEKQTNPGRMQLGQGLTEYVLNTGKPLLAKPEDSRYLADRGVIDLDFTSAIDWLGIPLKYEQETFGALVIQSYSPKIRYGERERDILLFVSEQIALSIHRKKMQQELIDAKQRAEVSSKLTSSLLANMNHELRTPMNGILGFAEILANELTDPDARSKAENILTSGRRLMDTLDAIMDLSYLESDKISRKFRPVSVYKVLRNLLAVYEPAVRRKNLKLLQQFTPDLMAMGDEQLFTHLMRNIIDNAVKYTEKGTITVRAVEEPGHDQYRIRISVKDSGIGIAEENHAMIFEAFRQVSEGYGRQFEGSGLGLTLSKKIITLLNGTITLESRIGEGSEFTVTIPSARGKEQAVEPEHAPLRRVEKKLPLVEIPEEVARTLPNLLVVEDNMVNLKLIMVYLQGLCNLFTAMEAKSAIRLARERRFDFILMDINLGPGMDGIQAMLEIRKMPEYRHIPIVAVTGYASIGDHDRLINIGFSRYLPKPFDRESILALFNELTDNRP